MATRQTFTKDELGRYFDRICLPKARRIYDASQLDDQQKLAFLNLMQKHHLCKCPWENIVQHYSWHKTVYLRPSHLFQKIVGNPGRGGYCFENNFFYHLILRSLGFPAYMCPSRVYKQGAGSYGGLTHVVNIIPLAGKKYLLDGGFGGQGPICAVPLEHGAEVTQIAPAQIRLMFEAIPNFVDPAQKCWVFQYRHNAASPWTPMYCFVEFECTPDDVQSMNFSPWLSRSSFFAHKVVCVRFTTDREKNDADGPGSPGEAELEGEIDGHMTINNDVVKWRRRGEKVVDVPFEKDQDRVDAFRKYYGIILSEEEQDSVKGTAAMIAGGAMGADGDS
ncbi:hypothetical protein BDY17DRAFT_317350 [Neohortaea acidophila]|uniref:Uncharacterized protein n=1 Tax=Neohortaea acidophila TaxID=245834 RepID=A0A6A6PRS8_9PEZI|nr:uncharacterized protein BDY17DRAFT_317350 [Neohortaea acidophila]KAF2482799.1 hypothetical protein BDY17DRAFT_317350 [Neohortaea acidophila]